MKKQLLNIALLFAIAGVVKAQVNFAPAVNFGTGITPSSVFSADFNEDGNMDLVTANDNSNNLSILLGTGTGTFGAAVNYGVGAGPYSVYSADFNGDGHLDLATANTQASNISVLLGSGTGTFATAVNFATGSAPRSIFSADFNGDGIMDLATSNIGSDNVSVLLGTGTGSFATAVNYGTGGTPRSIFSADFNGDGIMDLATSNSFSNNVSVLLGTGTGTFGTAVNYGTDVYPYHIFSADFNNDGKLDLATANYSSNTASVLLGTGTGSFSTAVNYAVGALVFSISSADFNRDGNMDIVTACANLNGVSVLLGSGTGTFAPTVNYLTNTATFGVHSADFNNDNKMDIVTANQYNYNVSVLLNTTQFGEALHFDGTNDFVNIPNNSSFNFGTNDFTIETYAKTSSIAGNRVMIGKINGGNNFWFGVSNGKANFSLIGGPDALGTSTIGDGNWHHLAAVRQNGIVSLYVDGVLEASQNNTGTATISGNLTLGNFNGGFNFPGSLDEVRLWNRALCKGEILNNKNAELPSSQTGLVAYYNFNQGLDNSNNSTVISLTDLSVNANNGTLNNFALSGTTSNWVAPGAVISGSIVPTYTLLSASAVVSATTICANALATVTISATGGTAAYSGVGTYTTNTPTNSYTVTDAHNCAATTTLNIIVNTLPTITVNNGSICAGESFTMVPTGADTYTYSSGTDITTPSANASYTVFGTDANGCENTAVSSVTVNALPVITSQSGNVTLCGDVSSTHSVSVAGTNTYEWYYTEIGGTDDGVINGSYSEINYTTNIMTIQQVLTGDYNGYGVYCIITNSNNCSVTSLIDTIVANPTPTVIVNSGVICAGQSFTMVPSGADTYTYSNGSDIAMPTSDATYTVTGTDALTGCENTGISSVTVNALPTLMIMTTNTLLCTGETATLSVMGASTYTWSTTENTTDVVVTPTSTTTYTVDGTDTNGCSNTTTITQDVSLCTGIVTLSNSNSVINVYPNPNNGLFVLELTTVAKVTVTNALGQVVIAETFEAGKHNLDIQNEATGVYFVKVIENNKQQIIKVIKQ